MDRDDIIRMAREIKGASRASAVDGSLWLLSESHLERFAALVAERDTALLRQALEALETFQKISDFTPAQGVHAITALRERLEGTV